MLTSTWHYVYKVLPGRRMAFMLGFLCAVICAGVLFFGNSSLNDYALCARETDTKYLECEQTCASSTGSAKYDCLRVCINAKKKIGPVNKNNTKENMGACEDACRDLSGLENVRCVRMCLDGK